MSLETDLIAAEREMWEGGPQAFRDHLDERCMVAFPQMAGVQDREAIAGQARDGRWTIAKLEPRGFLQPAEDAAAVAYECTATDSDGQTYRALVGSTYVKRDGEWKLAFHQQTPLQ